MCEDFETATNIRIIKPKNKSNKFLSTTNFKTEIESLKIPTTLQLTP